MSKEASPRACLFPSSLYSKRKGCFCRRFRRRLTAAPKCGIIYVIGSARQDRAGAADRRPYRTHLVRARQAAAAKRGRGR